MKAKTKYPLARSASAGEALHDTPGPLTTVPESATMIRTQIYLSRAQYDFLQAQARQRTEPMAAVLRSFVDEKMKLPEEVWENNSLLAPPADPAFVGPEDGIVNHDHYLYGGPKKWMKKKGKWVEAPPLPEDYYRNPKT